MSDELDKYEQALAYVVQAYGYKLKGMNRPGPIITDRNLRELVIFGPGKVQCGVVFNPRLPEDVIRKHRDLVEMAIFGGHVPRPQVDTKRPDKPKRTNKDTLHAEAEKWMAHVEQPDTANAFNPDAQVHGHYKVEVGVAIVRKFLETSTWPTSKKGQDLAIGGILNGMKLEIGFLRGSDGEVREPDMDSVRYFVAGYNYALGKLGIEVEES